MKKPLISVELTAYCPICHSPLSDKPKSVQLVVNKAVKSQQLSCTDTLCNYVYDLKEFKKQARDLMLAIKKEDSNVRHNEHEEAGGTAEETKN